jgi:predicted DNA-binding transcriptional regulator AlpA
MRNRRQGPRPVARQNWQGQTQASETDRRTDFVTRKGEGDNQEETRCRSRDTPKRRKDRCRRWTNKFQKCKNDTTITELLGIGHAGIRYTRQHLHRLEASNKFPKRVKIGEHSIAWVESEIDEYLEKRIAERG